MLIKTCFIKQILGNIFFNTPHRKVRTSFPPKWEKVLIRSFPIPTLVPNATYMCPHLRLGHKQCSILQQCAAFFPFSAGNEYEFYDSCAKKLYIALVNVVGCANLRVSCPCFARATTHAQAAHSPFYSLGV